MFFLKFITKTHQIIFNLTLNFVQEYPFMHGLNRFNNCWSNMTGQDNDVFTIFTKMSQVQTLFKCKKFC